MRSPNSKSRLRAAVSLSAVGGVILFLGWAGFGFWPLELVALVPFWAALELVAGRSWRTALGAGWLYGTIGIAGEAIGERQLARLDDGDGVTLHAGADGGRLLLLAARPLDEPIAHHGPFVMNTRAEIDQAITDYREGRLTA